jgi:butyryl-CoA dehydrogenase
MADYKSILFADMIKEFAENEVKPLAQQVDEEERFPLETVEKWLSSVLWVLLYPRNTEEQAETILCT